MATNTQSHNPPVNSESPGTHRHGVEPSGPRGDNPSTAGPGPTGVRSKTPENSAGHINPSPEDSNATPDTVPEK
jgi:hypothetical protein